MANHSPGEAGAASRGFDFRASAQPEERQDGDDDDDGPDDVDDAVHKISFGVD
jgi:hypothetical protein